MQAAIEALRRELRALEEMIIRSKDEIVAAHPGSENETQVILANAALMREYREISEGIDLLTRAEEIRARRAS